MDGEGRARASSRGVASPQRAFAPPAPRAPRQAVPLASVLRGPILLLLSLTTLLVTAAVAQDGASTYRNPVIEPVGADPSVLRDDDGTYYLVATQDNWDGRLEHFVPIFRSADLVSWEFVGDAFALPPAWKSGGFLWAPHLTRWGDRYHLYYSYSLWGDPNPCIGVARAASPVGPWEDLGRPVFCSDDIGVRNSIDPFVWHEDGRALMIWGSFNGIYAVELSEDGSEAVGDKIHLADNRFEAPYLIRRGEHYYLFLSSGSCCEGGNSTYLTWVARGDSPTGPFLDSVGRDVRYGGGDVLIYRNDEWVGPGHNAVAQDDAGQDWIIYHAIDPRQPLLPNGATRRPVLLDRIEWVDGWPVVNGGDGPSVGERTAPVIR